MDTSSTDVTAKLIAWSEGDTQAMDEVYPLIESELRRLARGLLNKLQPGSAFETTVLINEAYLRLVDQTRTQWNNRAHFFALAAKMMRWVLLNHHRDRRRAKRGGGAYHLTISSGSAKIEIRMEEMMDVNDALDKLEKIDPVKARIVEMKFFGGMKNDEISEVLAISPASIVRYWKFTKAWLKRELGHDEHE